jgi:hypothetical protein
MTNQTILAANLCYEPGIPLDAQTPALIEAIRLGIHLPEPLQESKQQRAIGL